LIVDPSDSIYRGTWRIKTRALLGPYSRPMSRALCGSWEVRFLISEVSLYMGRTTGEFWQGAVEVRTCRGGHHISQKRSFDR